MKIGITGITGFIGSRVAALAEQHGHEVVGFSRSPKAGMRRISEETPPDLTGLDAMVNLAGESILGLWTKGKKRRIEESRVEGTRRIVVAMTAMANPPRVLVNGSAIGYYGATGEAIADEYTAKGEGFLGEVCQKWEAEARKAEQAKIRVVMIRIGMVLGKGGAMALIRKVFGLGLGGNLGNGKQWMSAVHVDDVAGLIVWAVENEFVTGPVNAVLPEPFRNKEFTRTLAKVMRRPAILPAPKFAMEMALGELSHVLLDSMRVVPKKARGDGYLFQYPTLEDALRASLGR
ncbi:hypothetical protein BH09VER1_BH09VER1_03400 [soil metagenome]